MEIEINTDWNNKLIDKEEVSLGQYLEVYKSRITQDSERLFVIEFLFPILGKNNIKFVVPQYPFIDSEGRKRRIDFALNKDGKKIALEVNGETYHAEGVIPHEMFDDNLNRQNEILGAGYQLLRFSYTQLQSSDWRKKVQDAIRRLITKQLPELISATIIKPNYLQNEVLDALEFYRKKGRKNGIVILPTGTGKTYLSAFDTLNTKGKILFIVHRLDILSQNREAFEKIYPQEKFGLLTGEVKENVLDSKILFASKDSLINPEILGQFNPNYFDYIIVDEVHHGQAPSYKVIFDYFEPSFFMLGLTATPDRMDRRDIFELFDYNLIFEYTLNDAIENEFLVPYDYYGLKDNIDYSKIKHNGIRYNVQDLDRKLIIPERNKQILKEYQEKGKGNKAIGFCCSIKHAESMAKYFTKNGIPSVSITSESDTRKEDIEKFRENNYSVAFTVDLFNEGVDFPNVRVLLFLRPTESKTIFIQQLGRGLRLSSGKENVVILDFISNYRKANNIRKLLSKKSTERKNYQTGRIEKIEYEYTPKCNIYFDAEVEQILDRQDTIERKITKEDLIDAYYTLAEQLKHKPSQSDINSQGEFKMAKYLNVFGSWVKFLREIGEYTEASYQFPQGTHLGHVLYIIKTIDGGNIENSHLADKYVRIRGNLSQEKRLGGFQRQTKYKLQAVMEMGLIVDDRTIGNEQAFKLQLTPKGVRFLSTLRPIFNNLNLDFKTKDNDVPSWEMLESEDRFNEAIRNQVNKSKLTFKTVVKIFFNMKAVELMHRYLFGVENKVIISKSDIYKAFFNAPFVKQFCDRNGIEAATEEGAKHRCPFLLNILEAVGVLEKRSSEIELKQFIASKHTITIDEKETEQEIKDRLNKILGKKYPEINKDNISVLREKYGEYFLSDKYIVNNINIVD